jgi:hypothetical protein
MERVVRLPLSNVGVKTDYSQEPIERNHVITSTSGDFCQRSVLLTRIS